MADLDKIKFKFWDDTGTVKSLIARWQPQGCKSEKDYENSLYDFLHRELPDIQVTKQYQKGRVRTDLLVSDRVIVELKIHLRSKANYQRLLGQLAELKQWPGSIIVLLIGDTDPNLSKSLRAYVEDWTDDYFILFPKVIVIEK